MHERLIVSFLDENFVLLEVVVPEAPGVVVYCLVQKFHSWAGNTLCHLVKTCPSSSRLAIVITAAGPRLCGSSPVAAPYSE